MISDLNGFVGWNRCQAITSPCPWGNRKKVCEYVITQHFKSIEKKLGRKKAVKNSPRECDIDIIAYGNKIIRNKLDIPHLRMHNRSFVLIPLYELNQNWVHPKLNINIKNLIFSLPIKDIRSIKQI